MIVSCFCVWIIQLLPVVVLTVSIATGDTPNRLMTSSLLRAIFANFALCQVFVLIKDFRSVTANVQKNVWALVVETCQSLSSLPLVLPALLVLIALTAMDARLTHEDDGLWDGTYVTRSASCTAVRPANVLQTGREYCYCYQSMNFVFNGCTQFCPV